MRIREVAETYGQGITAKDVIAEVERLREDLESRGYKVAKRLTASSGLDPEAVSIVMGALDNRQQSGSKEEKEVEARKQAEEADRRRMAEQRKREDEERKAREEEARKQAEEAAARRRAEMARIAAMPPVAPPAAAGAPPRLPSAAAPPPVAPAGGAPRISPPQGAPGLSPLAPAASAVSAPAAQAPVAPPASAPAQPANAASGAAPAPPAAPHAPTAPPQGPPQIQSRGPAGPQSLPPRAPSGPPPAGGPPRGPMGQPPMRPPSGPQAGRPPYGGGPGRPSGGPPPRDGRPGGPPPRDGRPGGPRDGRPMGPSAGGPGRPPREGARPGGPGGYNRGPGGPGGDRRRPNDSAPLDVRGVDLEEFEGNMQPSVGTPSRRRRDTGGGKDKDRRGAAGAATPGAGGDEEARRRKAAAKPADRAADPTKRYRPSQVFTADRRAPRGQGGGGGKGKKGGFRRGQTAAPQAPRVVKLYGDFTIGQFADRAGVSVADVMGKLMQMGQLLTINQLLDPDMAELIAEELGVQVQIVRESDELDVIQYVDQVSEDESKFTPRPPVVTIMGHVDHGKTTLLDSIRKTKVVDTEHGGITQHIGAYHVTTEKGSITFLDTPGHAAFTAMRARGANVTDIVILVVAANDGVMPQTEEAINHAKAADVPIIVAINKVDAPGANSLRVKQELMRFELVGEELGGETLMAEVSALKGQGIDGLLEQVLLQAEVMELRANGDRPAIGTIIESRVDPLRGATATVLVQEGTLKIGDYFLCGTEYGRIRAMMDDRGETVKEAGPSMPVGILGLSGSPTAGEQFVVLPSEYEAREIAEKREHRRRTRTASQKGKPHVTLETLADTLKEGEVKELNLIVKADVQGSVEAVNASLLKIVSDKVKLRILHSGVGAITEGDVQLADASDAVILGFNTRPEAAARNLAEQEGVDIKTYNIIYELLEEIEKAMRGMLEPEFEEIHMGRLTVQQPFKISKFGTIAGCIVEEGKIARDHKVRLVRNGSVVYNGSIRSLRRVKEDVREVNAGTECGVALENFNDIKAGDVIESYVLNQLEASLVST